jgi:hypothetical protein
MSHESDSASRHRNMLKSLRVDIPHVGALMPAIGFVRQPQSGHNAGDALVKTVARRRRELSLWPLAIIVLLGALVVVGAIVVASRIGRTSSPDARLLDALVADARLMTPPGAREVGLTRFSCAKRADSAPPTVVRELRIAAGSSSAVRDEIVSAYVSSGWQRNGNDPRASVMRGRRAAYVAGSSDSSVITIAVDDSSVLC